MTHKFLEIHRIEDVLPYVQHKKEFCVRHTDQYITIDYSHNDENTFDSPQAMECRGIKFYPDGTIAARPFQKFFNRGERKDLEEKFAQGSFVLKEKLDGSMIHPMLVNGVLRLCTKAGVTEVSEQCEREVALTEVQKERLKDFCLAGTTVLMEYTSPNNRIVVGYDKPTLTVLALRDNVTGLYGDAETAANHLSLPFAKTYHTTLDDVKHWTDKEGVVIEYAKGYRLKLKADDYVLRHKTKDAISQEKNVLKLVLEDKVDDMVGVMTEQDYQRLQDYSRNVLKNISKQAQKYTELVEHFNGLERKDVARKASGVDGINQSVFWRVWDGHDAEGVVRDMIGKNLASQTRVDSVRGLIGGVW